MKHNDKYFNTAVPSWGMYDRLLILQYIINILSQADNGFA
jgi:hypothetical protein